ncbi:MAG: TetR family transcriptional regulator C-terminal domain-containing protein [Cyanobacteria bacterium J06634_5]
MKRTRKRDDLIRVGRDLIGRQGFNSTGLSDILATAGVPKGSFYYYFESKEEFGLAIIEDFASDYQAKLETTLGNEQLSPLARLNSYFEIGIAEMAGSGCQSGCLIGNLAQELSAQNEVFRDRLNQILTRWEACFSDCIAAAYAAGELTKAPDADAFAKFVLSGWQGAMLRAKVTRSTEPLNTFIQVLFEQVLGASVPQKSAAG